MNEMHACNEMRERPTNLGLWMNESNITRKVWTNSSFLMPGLLATTVNSCTAKKKIWTIFPLISGRSSSSPNQLVVEEKECFSYEYNPFCLRISHHLLPSIEYWFEYRILYPITYAALFYQRKKKKIQEHISRIHVWDWLHRFQVLDIQFYISHFKDYNLHLSKNMGRTLQTTVKPEFILPKRQTTSSHQLVHKTNVFQLNHRTMSVIYDTTLSAAMRKYWLMTELLLHFYLIQLLHHKTKFFLLPNCKLV